MFIGREHELAQMNSVLARPTASMIVISGRRRIGKSRLIKEFIKPFKSYTFISSLIDMVQLCAARIFCV